MQYSNGKFSMEFTTSYDRNDDAWKMMEVSPLNTQEYGEIRKILIESGCSENEIPSVEESDEVQNSLIAVKSPTFEPEEITESPAIDMKTLM